MCPVSSTLVHDIVAVVPSSAVSLFRGMGVQSCVVTQQAALLDTASPR